ncbi:MAG TPA: hypothetical protein VIB39_22850 [Candidatus Angelobacter sp.]|jgi:hypothetical protein
MRITSTILALLFTSLLIGCRAHMVTIKLVNTSAEAISTIIVDYPSATFGKDRLAPGETYSSSVKFIDTGNLKVQFTDAKGGNHTYSGPTLYRDAEGTIEVRLDQNNASAFPNLITR